MYGKILRMKRLVDPSRRMCVVPMDHGITLGPIKGLENYSNTIDQVAANGADAIILHKGLLLKVIEHQKTNVPHCRYILHLSASTSLSPDVHSKTLVSSVEEALMLGVDGVSMHVNLGCADEKIMIGDLGRISGECQKWGMPLLAMMYVSSNDENNSDKIIHAARIAEELGADIIKIDCLHPVNKLEKLMQGVHTPVLIAGGPKTNEVESLLQMIASALEMGVAGAAIGRNIFQHARYGILTLLISRMIHGELSLPDAVYELKRINE